MVETGEADFTNMYKTPEREKLYTFSEQPILPITIRFFRHMDERIIFNGNLKSISGKKIGVVNKISYGKEFDTALKDGVFKNVIHMNRHKELVSLLANKRVDLIIGAGYVINSFILEENLQKSILPISPALSDTDAYNAFTKKRDMREVADKLDTALQSMRDDGTFSEIIYNALQTQTN